MHQDCVYDKVNIGSGNGLVPSGIKQLTETVFTNFYDDISSHWVPMS